MSIEAWDVKARLAEAARKDLSQEPVRTRHNLTADQVQRALDLLLKVRDWADGTGAMDEGPESKLLADIRDLLMDA